MNKNLYNINLLSRIKRFVPQVSCLNYFTFTASLTSFSVTIKSTLNSWSNFRIPGLPISTISSEMNGKPSLMILKLSSTRREKLRSLKYSLWHSRRGEVRSTGSPHFQRGKMSCQWNCTKSGCRMSSCENNQMGRNWKTAWHLASQLIIVVHLLNIV